MRAVCAWCKTTMAEGEPGDPRVSHGICPECARKWFGRGPQYVVVPADRSFLFPEIQAAFQDVRGIQVILDRRRGERRLRRDHVLGDRRGSYPDRRRQPCLVAGAIPAVAGLRVCG
jgi:hypothetical protein